MNLGDGRFCEAASALGVDSLRDGRGLAMADFDGDGDLDLVVNNYNAAPHYYANGCATGHWLQLRLIGHRSNRDAVGATVRASAGGRQMMRVVTAGSGYGSQDSRIVHFGLGAAETVDELEIRWPSGHQQRFLGVPVDRRLVIEEHQAAISVKGAE